MNDKYEIKKEDYEQYWQKGGTYVMPIEVFNDLFYDIEQLQQENYNLKQIDEEHQKLNGELRKENNILIEFEHWLEETINYLGRNKESYEDYRVQILTYKYCLDKLQELKEGKK